MRIGELSSLSASMSPVTDTPTDTPTITPNCDVDRDRDGCGPRIRCPLCGRCPEFRRKLATLDRYRLRNLHFLGNSLSFGEARNATCPV